MNNNNFQTINHSELQDFKKSCKDRGINPGDFNLQEHDVTQTPTGNGLFHPNGKLTISKNGKSKTYETGNDTHWPADFDKDLRSGFFN